MLPDLFERRPIAILLSLTALFFWQLIFSSAFTYLDSPDLVSQVLPWYNAQAIAWSEGSFPTWDPFVYGGQPLLGQMQPGAAFWPNWPVFWAPMVDGHVNVRLVDMHYGVMHLLPALFMFGLARELGCSRYASVVAGVAFACSGFISSVGWPQMLHGAIWLPLTFWMFHRFVRLGATPAGWASAVLCGSSIGMSVLSGHHQTPFFSLLAFAGLCLYFGGVNSGPVRRRIGLGFVAVGIVAVFVAGLQLLPAVEYGADAYRWADAPEPLAPEDRVPYFVHEERRLFAITLLGLVIRAVHFDVNTFVGWVVLVFALFAAMKRLDERWTKLYCGLGVGALFYGLGALSPLHDWIYQFLPIADKARSSSHSVFVLQFALILLAAFGIDAFLERFRDGDATWRRGVKRVLVGYALLSWVLIYFHASGGIMEVEPGDYIAMSSFFALGLAALIEARERGAVKLDSARLALAALFFFELYSGRSHLIHDRSDPDSMESFKALAELDSAAKFVVERRRQELEASQAPSRFLLFRDGGVLNIGGWYGAEQSGGFLASLSRGIQGLYSDVGWWETKDLLATKYVIAKEAPRDYLQLIHEADNGWNVYLNPNAAPRASVLFSDQYVTNSSGDSVPSAPSCDSDGSVSLREWSTDRIHLATDSPCESYVVLADPVLPGWKVNVNGREAELLTYRGALRAVRTPEGLSEIEFVYRPTLVRFGGALTGLGMLMSLGAFFVLLRSRRR